jgi:hypothetical protein
MRGGVDLVVVMLVEIKVGMLFTDAWVGKRKPELQRHVWPLDILEGDVMPSVRSKAFLHFRGRVGSHSFCCVGESGWSGHG